MARNTLRWNSCALVALVAVTVWTPVLAQDDADRLFGLNIGGMLKNSAALRAEKRAIARDGNWAFGSILSVRGGYNDNIYLAPEEEMDAADLENDSFFFETALQLRALRYYTPNDRLKLQVRAHNVDFVEDSKVNVADQEFSALYRHRFSPDVEAWIAPSIKHENDHSVSILGESFSRDFEYYSYHLEAGIRVDMAERHQLKLSYSAKRKDYEETSGKDSIDWWRHGPAMKYRYRIRDRWAVRLWYELWIQEYDDDRASAKNGTEVTSTPKERHLYHRPMLWISWEPSDRTKVSAKYRVRAKDDRFQGFESYLEHGLDLSVSHALTSRLSAKLSGYYRVRDFKNRKAENSDDLEYDKYGFVAGISYQLSNSVAFYGDLSFIKRDTNRSTGTSYRDYDVTVFGAGISIAF